MLFRLAIIAGLTLLLQGCVNRPTPPPLDGVDIYDGKNKGDICFTPFYLNNYLQWKSTQK